VLSKHALLPDFYFLATPQLMGDIALRIRLGFFWCTPYVYCLHSWCLFLCDHIDTLFISGMQYFCDFQMCLLPVCGENQSEFCVLSVQVSDIVLVSHSPAMHVFVPVLPLMHYRCCLVNMWCVSVALGGCSSIFSHCKAVFRLCVYALSNNGNGNGGRGW